MESDGGTVDTTRPFNHEYDQSRMENGVADDLYFAKNQGSGEEDRGATQTI